MLLLHSHWADFERPEVYSLNYSSISTIARDVSFTFIWRKSVRSCVTFYLLTVQFYSAKMSYTTLSHWVDWYLFTSKISRFLKKRLADSLFLQHWATSGVFWMDRVNYPLIADAFLSWYTNQGSKSSKWNTMCCCQPCGRINCNWSNYFSEAVAVRCVAKVFEYRNTNEGEHILPVWHNRTQRSLFVI